jgi:hypothetical protein
LVGSKDVCAAISSEAQRREFMIMICDQVIVSCECC